jgi:hypothetical protein
MSQFQRKYSDRQRRAIVIAQLDHGMSAKVAIERLQEGKLHDGIGLVEPPAEAMPIKTAQSLARDERRTRQGRRGGLEGKEPAVARAEMLRRLTIAADRLTSRLERKSKNAKDAELADLLAKAARATAAVISAQRSNEAPKRIPPAFPTGDANGSPDPEAAASPLDAIARNLERADRSNARKQH